MLCELARILWQQTRLGHLARWSKKNLPRSQYNYWHIFCPKSFDVGCHSIIYAYFYLESLLISQFIQSSMLCFLQCFVVWKSKMHPIKSRAHSPVRNAELPTFKKPIILASFKKVIAQLSLSASFLLFFSVSVCLSFSLSLSLSLSIYLSIYLSLSLS